MTRPGQLLYDRQRHPQSEYAVHCRLTRIIFCPRPLGGGIKRWCCLASVCLCVAYIGPKSRTERSRKTKIGTAVAHVTRDWDTTFKVKRSNVKVTRPLWLAVLAGQHGHRVSNGSRCVYDVYRVITCRPGRGILWRSPAYSLLMSKIITVGDRLFANVSPRLHIHLYFTNR